MNKHNLLMALCMGAPIALLVVVYAFGIKSPIIYWIALAMCPIMHLVMMKQPKGGKKCN